jgi:hypothetical protein
VDSAAPNEKSSHVHNEDATLRPTG